MLRNLLKRDDERTAATATATAARPSTRTRTIAPPVDIVEDDRALVLTADLPGVSQDGIDVTLDQGVLTLRGTRARQAHDGFQAVWREYEPADYERSFTLAEGIDRDAVSAVIRNGVLTLTLPKSKAAQPRRIAVTSA